MNKVVLVMGAVILVAGLVSVFYSTTKVVGDDTCVQVGVAYDNHTGSPHPEWRCSGDTVETQPIIGSQPTVNTTVKPYYSDGLLLGVIAIVTFVIGLVMPKGAALMPQEEAVA